MTSLTDAELLADAQRLEGKVALITGSAKGIGRETALLFSKYNAKVVVSDIDIDGANRVVKDIIAAGGSAVAFKCDVRVWEDVDALFAFAMETYGAVDIAIPNAGVAEVGIFKQAKVVEGKIQPPNLKTLQVNLIGAMYVSHLALHYMSLPEGAKQTEAALHRVKAIVLLGSMASWQAVGDLVMYTTTKHAILGLMRSLELPCKAAGIRIGIVHPWFVETDMLTTGTRIMLAGLPLAPVGRVASTILRVATDPDPETSACPWLLLDGGNAMRMNKEQLSAGAYEIMKARINTAHALMHGIRYRIRIIKDVYNALPILRPMVIGLLVVAGGAIITSYTN